MEITTFMKLFAGALVLPILLATIREEPSWRAAGAALLHVLVACFYTVEIVRTLIDPETVDHASGTIAGDGAYSLALSVLFVWGAVAAGVFAGSERRGWPMAFVAGFTSLIFIRTTAPFAVMAFDWQRLLEPVDTDTTVPMIVPWAVILALVIAVFVSVIVWSIRRMAPAPGESQAELLRMREEIDEALAELELEEGRFVTDGGNDDERPSLA